MEQAKSQKPIVSFTHPEYGLIEFFEEDNQLGLRALGMYQDIVNYTSAISIDSIKSTGETAKHKGTYLGKDLLLTLRDNFSDGHYGARFEISWGEQNGNKDPLVLGLGPQHEIHFKRKSEKDSPFRSEQELIIENSDIYSLAKRARDNTYKKTLSEILQPEF